MEEKKSCWCCLLDFSFEELITVKLVKALYLIGICVSGIVGICLIIKAFGQNFGTGLLYIVAALIVPVLLVLAIRIVMEILLTLFRIEENTRYCNPETDQIADPAEEITPEPEVDTEE